MTTAFLDFVIDQLADVESVMPRRMFGATGLYSGDVFFGIVHRDVLYLKVDDSTRGAYERAGMEPFRPYKDRPTKMQYYEVPAHVLEDREALTKWATRAVEVAVKARAGKRAALT